MFTFQDEPEQVHEYVDEKGRRVKRIIRKTYVTKTVTIKGQQVVEQELGEEYPEVSADELEPILAGKFGLFVVVFCSCPWLANCIKNFSSKTFENENIYWKIFYCLRLSASLERKELRFGLLKLHEATVLKIRR